jgi:CBS domain-containing membrane protein
VDGDARRMNAFVSGVNPVPHSKPHLSMRTRWLMIRAWLSAPGLLTRFDEEKVVSAITAIHGGVAILTIGVFAWLTDLPLVFPSLGPTAFILFSAPMSPAAAPRSAVLGHLVGLLSGFLIWQAMALLTGGSTSSDAGGWQIFCGASLSLALTCLLLVRLSCPHAPACASAMLVAVGSLSHWYELCFMALGVVWLAAQAVVMNRLAGLPVPTWSPQQHETP